MPRAPAVPAKELQRQSIPELARNIAVPPPPRSCPSYGLVVLHASYGLFKLQGLFCGFCCPLSFTSRLSTPCLPLSKLPYKS